MTLDSKSIQTRFLGLCATSGNSLTQVLTELRIEPATLARWLVQRGFRVRVSRLRKSLALSRELALAIGAVRAAQVLAGSVEDPSKCNHRACIELIRLSRDVKARRRAEDRPQKRALKKSADELPIHPDLNQDEAKSLLDELKSAS